MSEAPRKRSGARFWLFFPVICVAAFLLEHLAEAWVYGDHPGVGSRTLFNIGALYHLVVAGDARFEYPSHATLLELNKTEDAPISVHAYCEQRELMAGLIEAVTRAHPSVIVVDKYYDPLECREHRGTDALIAAVTAAARRTPVIVGLVTYNDSGQLEAGPNLDLCAAEAGCPNLHYALVDLDVDTRRLPLGFPVENGDGQSAWRESLALAASRSHRPELVSLPTRMQLLLSRRDHPFSSLVDPAHFKRRFAGDVLCASWSGKRDAIAACDSRSATRAKERDFVGRVVVIGDNDGERDLHRTRFGVLPGFVLQANYIEAILDQRYLISYPILDYIAGFAFFGLCYYVFMSGVALGAGLVILLAGSAVMMLCIIAIAASPLGIYLDPKTINLFALVVLLGHLIAERLPMSGPSADGPETPAPPPESGREEEG